VRIAARGARGAPPHVHRGSLDWSAVFPDPGRRERHDGSGVRADGASLADEVRLVARLQLAEAAVRRRADHPPSRKRYGQRCIVFFVSDHDPSGLDLQHAWEEALSAFGAFAMVERIGLTREQVTGSGLSAQLQQGIEVKPSDSRAARYIEQHGNRCWEVDILPATVIAQAIDDHIASWLDVVLWDRRAREIEQARSLL